MGEWRTVWEVVVLGTKDNPRSVPMPDRRQFEGPRTRRELFAFLKREKQNKGTLFGS